VGVNARDHEPLTLDLANQLAETEAERSLIEAAKSGSTSAFHRLYERNANVVFSYLDSRVGFHDAEDATAEVFCTAWRKLPDYEWRGTPFRGWLLTIAKNLIRGQARRDSVISVQVTRSGSLEVGIEDAAETKALQRNDSEIILTALGTMSPNGKAILTLRFLEELSVQESAERIGCSEENVRVRTFRALKELRALTAGEIE